MKYPFWVLVCTRLIWLLAGAAIGIAFEKATSLP